MDLILKHFPDLTDQQIDQYTQLWDLYQEWNQKINVISRKDIDNLYPHHVLHSLCIAKFITFVPETKVLDLGTGGGFPAIPLAILFPDVHFTAVDGTRKKITVVNEVATALGLKNIRPIHTRAEEHKETFEFVVTRAVATSDKLVAWTERSIDINEHKNILPNGIIALKGGNPKNETKTLSKKAYTETKSLIKIIPEPCFEDKYILYIQR